VQGRGPSANERTAARMRKGTEAGIDVSTDVLDVAVRRDGVRLETARFDNDAAGHRALVRWLTKHRRPVWVVLESPGTYSLDVAVALHRARRVAVMVANPRAITQFAGTLMQRSKTDLTAAAARREYAARMPFLEWQPPAGEVLALRGIARRIAAVVVERTRERNGLHAPQATAERVAIVVNDIAVNVRHLERRIEILTAEAVALVREHVELQRALERLTSVAGIATHTAVQLLPELLGLPDDMTVRQWVAHAGLDPCASPSGTSVDKPARIAKVGNAHIRRVLFMPALVAVQHDPHVKAFSDKLIARGTKPIQAYVALMRKLLHAIYGMGATETTVVAEKFHAAA
jgi:transposase